MSDPFNILNEDIYRFIFQHLDVNDIQKLSLVSRLWYHNIGSSRECMNKLIYQVDTESQLKTLLWTVRKYEHFKITPFGLLKELTNVLQHFKVKSMRINEFYGKEIDHCDYIRLIESFAATVEYLMLSDVATRNSTRLTKVINFPNLKKCHCTFTNRTAFSILLGNNPKLEYAVISADLLSRDDGEFLRHDNVIIKFLRKNNKIKKLCFLNLEKLFLHDMSLIVNTVRHFTFTTHFTNKPKHVRENFLKFLKAQNHLEKVHIMGCQSKRILVDIWNSVKHGRHFIIDCNIHEELLISDLQRNTFIEEIDFYLTSSLLVIFFLQASPNIKYFKVRQLSKQLLDYCINHLKYLRVITFQSIDSDAALFYKEYKRTREDHLKLRELDFFEYLNIDKKNSDKVKKRGYY